MDNSRVYIEMCRKATEIQLARPIYPGEPAPPPWLWRADQLQEMVDTPWARREVAFYDFIFEKANSVCTDCFNAIQGSTFVDGHPVFETLLANVGLMWKSQEQAWLAFVMHTNYRKTWDDATKEWVEGE